MKATTRYYLSEIGAFILFCASAYLLYVIITVWGNQ